MRSKLLTRLVMLVALALPVSLSAQVAMTNLQPPRTTGTLTTAVGAGSTVSVSSLGFAVATVTVNGTYAGETINFEFSDDTGTSWYGTQCTRVDANLQETSEVLPSNQSRAWDCAVYATTNFRVRSSAITSGTVNVGITISAAPIEPAQTVSLATGSVIQGTLTDNSAAPSTSLFGDLIGIARNDYGGGTAATAGRAVMPDVGTDRLLHVAMLPDLSLKRYRASSKFAASSTTDNWRINGNASNTVVVTDVRLTCTQTTSSVINVELIKHSAAASGGTAGTPTAVPLDSNKAAASSVVNSYTGTGPTVGAAVGDLDNQQITCEAPGSTSGNDLYVAPHAPGSPVAVLRTTSEGLAINIGNAALTGGNLTVTVEWTEITTITP